MKKVPIAELEARLAAARTPPVDPVAHIDALTTLAWELGEAEVERAHALAAEARQLAIEHGYPLGQARAARTMAMTTFDIQGLGATFALGEEAKQKFDEANDGAGRAASRDFLAGVYEYIGDLAAGLEYALDALSIAREIDDPVRQGYALCNVGGILAASGEVDEGIARLKEALHFFEGVANPQGIGRICSQLSKIYRESGKLDQALAYAERCRDAAQQTDDSYPRADAFGVLAELHAQQGNAEEAERLYRAALDSCPPAVKKAMGPALQIPLGRLLTQRGALVEAERELSEALRDVQDTAISMTDEAAAHNALASLRERQGDLAATIDHLRQAQRLREQVAQQDARNKIAQVEVRAEMETAKKEAETQKLRFAELHAMQSKLVEAEKMALLGKLAAGTAHELNTPLAVLQNDTSLVGRAAERLAALAPDTELGSRASKLVAVVESCRRSTEEAMERVATIARSFRRFTQLDQADRCAFDVAEGLDSALALLGPTLPAEIEIVRRLESVPKIDGWPRELNHAFMTVLQNASQAISGQGTITAEACISKGELLVRIHDTGRGMTAEQAANLFDVAWSEVGNRTSMRLGLSAAYSTMQKHGGTLEVDSTPGVGTTMTFRFPSPCAS